MAETETAKFDLLITVPPDIAVMDPEDPDRPLRDERGQPFTMPASRYVVIMSNSDHFRSSVEGIASAMNLINAFRKKRPGDVVGVYREDWKRLGDASKEITRLSQLTCIVSATMGLFKTMERSARPAEAPAETKE